MAFVLLVLIVEVVEEVGSEDAWLLDLSLSSLYGLMAPIIVADDISPHMIEPLFPFIAEFEPY